MKRKRKNGKNREFLKYLRYSGLVFFSALGIWILLSCVEANSKDFCIYKYSRWNIYLFLDSDKEVPVRSPPNNAEVKKLTRKIDMPKRNLVRSISAKVSKEDVMNLARIIHVENGGHPNDEALILTGVVVLKRVKSKQFPNTIMGVVSQEGQYATWMDGKFYCKPSKRSIKIARRLLTTDLADKYPDSLIYQAEFPQGSKVYKKLGFEYFCLE